MIISKRNLVLKIARARAVADECKKKYGGCKCYYLVGAYENVFADLLGVYDFNELLDKVEKNA